MPKLTFRQVKSRLERILGWRKKADAVGRRFEFQNFPKPFNFVDATAKIAEKEQPHPDIDIRWNKVTILLTTHNEAGLTEKDFRLTEKCDLPN